MTGIELIGAALVAYACGAVAGVGAAVGFKPARIAAFLLPLAGAVLQAAAAIGVLLGGAEQNAVIASGIPLLDYGLRLDAISALFNLALALLGGAISVYSLGYLREAGNGRAGIIAFFYNILLAGLTLVFTASNAFFFLIVWEVMAGSAYFLVSIDHHKAETRRAGLMFLVMSHAGTGLLLLAFLALSSASGSLSFASFHGLGAKLPGAQSGIVLLLFFFGFGVKAGIIPLHIWLPAAHPVAPSNISAIMSGIVIKTGIYGMVRVMFDFYDGVPEWAGVLVLVVGVVSALLGVLYALMEHDLKRLLAYHSIENIGIILIGLGSALLFRTFGHPQLAAIALVAALYHTLNHAIFKGLLFLGAGSVLHATGTKNMEEMGGLIRPMPVTAFCFLVGAVAISGLPPLNGFVSEWLTYQALLAGYGTTASLARIIFPITGALLALTAALAAACFVKAFGITFLALPRSEEAGHAHEAGFTMRAAMALLAAACFVLGLGATWIVPLFDSITRQTFGLAVSGNLTGGNGFVLLAGSAATGTVSTVGIALTLLILAAAPLVFLAVRARRARRVTGPTWDCGLPGLTAANEYTATAFSKPLRMIFAALYQPRREIQTEYEVSPYYPKAIRFESEIHSRFEKHLYEPFNEWILAVASRMRGIQAGSIHAYLAYIFVTLILLLLFGARG